MGIATALLLPRAGKARLELQAACECRQIRDSIVSHGIFLTHTLKEKVVPRSDGSDSKASLLVIF